MYCPNCGSIIKDESSNFCEECGSSLDEVFSNEAVPAAGQKSSDKVWIALLVFVIIGVLGFLAYYFEVPEKIKTAIANNGSSNVQSAIESDDDVSSKDDNIYYDDDDYYNDDTESESRVDPNNIIPIVSISCSSHQNSNSYGRKFTPEMAIDGDPDSCWMAKSPRGYSAGAGNWLRLDLGGRRTVHGIKLLNGNIWNGYKDGKQVYTDLYYKNGRVKDFELEFSDGSHMYFVANDIRETYYDSNIFYFDYPVDTDYIYFNVKSGYAGYKYGSVVCLGEIAVF